MSGSQLFNGTCKIFLLPFAGASSYSYYDLTTRSNERFSFHPIEIPGRGRRHREPLVGDIENIALDTIKQMNLEKNVPYAIFGHSMGALLGFNVIRKQYSNGLPLPLHFFASGCAAPSCLDISMPRYNLPRQQLFNKIYELGGVQPEIQHDEQLRDFFEPILRSDFKAFDTYQYAKEQSFNIPITVITGEQDKLTEKQLTGWQKETNLPIEIVNMPGNHFFIFQNVDRLVQLINEKLSILQ